MKDNKGTTILLTVIGIATLLVAVVGATFAYFTAGVKDSDTSVDTDITVNSATVGTITFTHGNVIDLCSDEPAEDGTYPACVIYPGAQESKTFTVAADPNSTTEVEYVVSLEILANSFKTDALGYKVSAVNSDGTSLVAAATDYAALDSVSNSGKFAKKDTTTYVEIGRATLGTAGDTDTWTLDVLFENRDEAQDDEQGAELQARIVVEAASKFTTGGTLYEGNAQ